MILLLHASALWIFSADIQTAVNEGEDYVRYSNTLLPSAKNDVEKIAMCLVHFKKIESAGFSPAMVHKNKEEKACEIMQQIVCSTTNWEHVKVTYLSESDNSQH